MNEQEAEERSAQLAAEHPDRATHSWIPVKQNDGTWAVAKISLPPPVSPTGTEIKADPRPLPDNPQDATPGGILPPGWYGA